MEFAKVIAFFPEIMENHGECHECDSDDLQHQPQSLHSLFWSPSVELPPPREECGHSQVC